MSVNTGALQTRPCQQRQVKASCRFPCLPLDNGLLAVTIAHHGINGSFLVSKRESRKQFRRSILDAWNWRCAYCDACIKQQPTLDHVTPLSKGGLTARGNLVAACPSCNVSKSDNPVDEWFREQPFYCRQREWLIWWWRLCHGSMASPPINF